MKKGIKTSLLLTVLLFLTTLTFGRGLPPIIQSDDWLGASVYNYYVDPQTGILLFILETCPGIWGTC